MKTILLIEDESLVYKLLKKKLTREGFKVFIAKDGLNGFNKAKDKKPDLILLDMRLPKMDGFEVLKKLKKDSNLEQIPVIIVSNSGQPVELEKAKKMGINDWLIKTEFDPNEIIKKVKKIFKN